MGEGEELKAPRHASTAAICNCCGLSQSRHKHGKKDTCNLYDWIVYKRGSKAKEKERKRQAATREDIYNPWSREGHVSSASTTTTVFCQCRNKLEDLNIRKTPC